MKKFLAVASLVLAMALSSFAALTPYTSPKGDFTVSTPAPFTVKVEKSCPGKETCVTMTHYSAHETNGNILEVGTVVFPSPISLEQVTTTAENMVAEINGTVRAEADYNGGTAIIASVPGGQVMILARTEGSEAYILLFFAPQANVVSSGSEVGDIAASFKTLSKPKKSSGGGSEGR